MEKKIDEVIDEKALEVAKEIRPILEHSLNTRFSIFKPCFYQNSNNKPEENLYSLSIIVDLNKTIYVTVKKFVEGDKNNYHIMKLEVFP